MKKKVRILPLLMVGVLILSMPTVTTGCAGTTVVIATAVIIEKVLGWLFWWRTSPDPSVNDGNETELMKEEFARYVLIATGAMDDALIELIPEKQADTEDILYIQNIINDILDSYDFFAIWIAYQYASYISMGYELTSEGLRDLATYDNFKQFFYDYYLEYEISNESYKTAGGRVLTADEVDTVAAERAEKRGVLAEKEAAIETVRGTITTLKSDITELDGKITKAEAELSRIPRTETGEREVPNTAKQDLLERAANETNSQAQSAMRAEAARMPDYITETYTINNSQKITAKQGEIDGLKGERSEKALKCGELESQIEPAEAEIRALKTVIDKLLITVTTEIHFQKYDDVIYELGLDEEEVNQFMEVLTSVLRG